MTYFTLFSSIVVVCGFIINSCISMEEEKLEVSETLIKEYYQRSASSSKAGVSSSIEFYKNMLTNNSQFFSDNQNPSFPLEESLDEAGLYTLIDDPKGDNMCHIWTLLPLLFADQITSNKMFVMLLKIFSESVEKKSSERGRVRVAEYYGGGMLGIAKIDLTLLKSLAEPYLKMECEKANLQAQAQAAREGKSPKQIKLQTVSKNLVEYVAKTTLGAIRASLAYYMHNLLQIPETILQFVM